ncbi:NAD-dependent epimerase/dehydratase family protein [Candidatus Woesearchaeota archaeon]|jgi:nucleoside-diphosphate-sugar epimerase|nr:NAD-dependent epimerase/dehydratase family protein [Candidatus Woesearchaeota archaeon]
MKILITGGAGFIGKYLANRLCSEHEVTIIDNFYRKNNIELKNKVKIIEQDITKDFEDLISQNEVIYHLAAISQVMTSIEDPDLTFKVNIEATKNIIAACTKHKKKLIFASSREVYGTQTELPVKIDAELNPENPYAASKIAGESLIKSYAKAYNLDYNIVRMSNVYGLGDVERVIPKFIDTLENNKDIELYGSKKIIDFIYIDDVVNAFVKLKDKSELTLNLGSGVKTTLVELANLIKELTNSNSNINILSERQGEVAKFQADISETKSKLDWEPKTTLRDGLTQMINS